MQPWIGKGTIDEDTLRDSLKVLNVSGDIRNNISRLIDDYSLCSGILVWKNSDIPKLQRLVQAVLGFKDKDFENINTPEDLMHETENKLQGCSQDDISNICYILTSRE